MSAEELAERLKDVRERIAAAARRSGRNPEDVTLVSVTKSRPPDLLLKAHVMGLHDFGENRVAELLEKQESLTLPGVRWHFIGSLQRRKVKDLVGRAYLIHSIDRLSLARELSRRATDASVTVTGLLQVNTSGEESKSGWELYRPEARDAFLREVEMILSLPNLRLRGLMTMAPFYDEAERTRPVFAATREIRGLLSERFGEQSWEILSMGMTNDFEVAIEEGATHVRVGTALFGPRVA